MSEYLHTIKQANSKCRRCSLSSGKSIFGHSFGHLNNVQLIIISAYPAKEEIEKGYTLAPNAPKPRKNNQDNEIYRMNAGRFLQASISKVFDDDLTFPSELKPFYNRIFFTNAIKCSPLGYARQDKKQMDVTDTHLNICREWLELEIAEIAKSNPTVPILLAGSEAVKLIYKKEGVYNNRRKLHSYKGIHPVVITFNPVEPLRYALMEITKHKVRGDGSMRVEAINFLQPIPVGEMRYHWLNDLELVKQQVVGNYAARFRQPTDEAGK